MTDVQRGTKICKIIADATSQNYSADLVPLYQNVLQNNIVDQVMKSLTVVEQWSF